MRRADRLNALPASLAALALVVPLALVGLAAPAAAAPGDLARTGTATADVFQSDGDGTFPPDAAIDGNPATRWASGNGPDEDVAFTAWLQVDLGAEASVDHVVLAWEAAFAAGYEVQVATAPDEWTTVHTEAAGDGGTDDVTFAATDARYVRLQMNQRTSFDWDPARPHWYGYSLFSFEVYGTATQAAVAFATSGTTVPAGDDATVPLILATAAATDTTVRVRSTGGTGVRRHGLHRGRRDGDLPGRHHGGDGHRADRRPRPARPGPHGRADPVRAVRRPGAGRSHDEHRHHHPARRPAGRRRRHGARRLRVGRPRRLHHVGHQRAGHARAVHGTGGPGRQRPGRHRRGSAGRRATGSASRTTSPPPTGPRTTASRSGSWARAAAGCSGTS